MFIIDQSRWHEESSGGRMQVGVDDRGIKELGIENW